MNIRTRLTGIFLIISLIPVAVFGAIGYTNAEVEITNETLRKLEALASMEEEAIRTVMRHNIEKLDSFTSRVQVRIELDNYNANQSPKSLEFINNLIVTAKSQIDTFSDISILNPEGLVVASTDSNEVGKDHSDDEFFRVGRERNEIANFFLDKTGASRVLLTGPMFLNNSLIGVVAIASSVDDLYSITGSYATTSQTGESYLVQIQNGDILLVTPLRFESAAPVSVLTATSAIGEPAIPALQGNEGTLVDVLDYRGIPVLAVTRYIEEGNLGLVVKVDKQEALAPLDGFKALVVITGVMIGISIVITSFFLGKSISSPIQRLRDEAAEISKGNFDAKIGITRNDEVGELALSFDNMRNRIKSINENLQSIVREKTSQLEIVNEELKGKNLHLEQLNLQLEQQQEQLRNVDEAKEHFSAMITHELKTPLVPIIGYSELLVDGTLGELTKVQKEKVQLMHESALSLSKLISDLLDVRKLDLGKMKFDMIDTPVGEILDESVNSFKLLSESKKVALECNLDEQVARLRIRCDPRRLQQVLSNLLGNAVKFVPKDAGRVEVSAKNDGSSVVFSIKDNGIGIPKEKQGNLFRKFYQVDTSLRREAGGSGLGLVISKGIIEAHGGAIWFDSAPGLGSTFYFSIPLNQENLGEVGEK